MRRGAWAAGFALAAMFVAAFPAAAAGPALPVEPLAFPEGVDLFPPGPIPAMVPAPLPTTLHGHLKKGLQCQDLVGRLVVPSAPELPPFTDADGQPLRLPPAPPTPEFPPSDNPDWEFDGTVWRYESLAVAFERGNGTWKVDGLAMDVEYDHGEWSFDSLGPSWHVTQDAVEFEDLGQNWTILADEWSYETLGQSWHVDREGWSFDSLGASWDVRDGTATFESLPVDAEIRPDGWTYGGLTQEWNVTRSGWRLSAVWPDLPEAYPLGMNATVIYDGSVWKVVTPVGTCTSAASAPGLDVGAATASIVVLAWAAARRRR